MQIKITYNKKNNDNIVNYKNISQKIDVFIDKNLKIKNKNIELGIHFLSPKNIQILNNKYRKINQPTDVLSFPVYADIKKSQLAIDHNINLGDIFICSQVAKKQALQNNISLNREIENLIIHGLKHLIGIHHK